MTIDPLDLPSYTCTVLRLCLTLAFVAIPLAQMLPAASIAHLVCSDGSCGSGVGPGLTQNPLSGANFSTTSEARSQDFGNIGVRAQVDGTNVNGDIETHANVTLNDQLTVSGLTVGTVQFIYSIDASTTFNLTSGFTQLYVREGAVSDVLAPIHLLQFQATPNLGFSGQIPTALSTLSITQSFNSSLTYTFTLTAIVNCYTPGANSQCNGSGEVDALSTMTLQQVVVRDSQGNVVTNPIISSQSGFDYTAVATSAVPEPATWSLIILGLSIVMFARRSKPTSAETTL